MEKVTPIDKEYIYDGDVIISQTDINGFITYANRAFAQASDYKIDELVGKSQNIIRHPDMPKVIFAKMWETISGGQAWNGLVKNLRKDGMFYWVETEIIPILGTDETEITGYIAVRKEASRKNIKEAQETYKKMLETQE
ncbi:PAS domain S-box protein [Sulfurimonas sp. SAG-AH-194-C21]|nr:PAS domain S-box protein [Sulfurimonas sp. SAG-AH-194-C21]MDF1883207.1 PAS domain S-box protein [Sulfurimonas sp. SAG-AH-194-C21]